MLLLQLRTLVEALPPLGWIVGLALGAGFREGMARWLGRRKGTRSVGTQKEAEEDDDEVRVRLFFLLY